MAEVEIKEQINDVVSSIETPDVFFDAVAEDVSENKNPPSENGISNKQEQEEEDDFMKKIDEAISGDTIATVNEQNDNDDVISPPAKKICSIDIRRKSTENGSLKSNTEEDELLGCEKDFLDSIIDEKSENELLKDVDTNQIESELTESAPPEKEEEEKPTKNNDAPTENEEKMDQEEESESKTSATEDEKKSSSEKYDDDDNDNLLELSQKQPKEQQDSDDTDEISSDYGSLKTQTGELKSETTDGTTSTSTELKSVTSDEGRHSEVTEDDEVKQKSDIKKEENGQNEHQSDDEDKMVIDETPTVKTDDVEMADDESQSKSSESDEKPATKIEPKDEDEEEEHKTLEAIEFTFIKKFATSLGKLSRAELEEVVMHKLAEKIVYDKKYSECRIKCEKQEEIIENLKTKIATLSKQYNDMQMIHDRIRKDLAERPDQPVTPVKITRAVGLQVYPPTQPNVKSKPSLSPQTTMTMVKKRTSDAGSSFNSRESEAKKKRSGKIITPLRPPLSERERASLAAQEATIEQNLRKIIKQPDTSSPQVTIRPVLARSQPQHMANGTAINKPNIDRTKAISSSSSASQPIDLTDEDEMPTNPPALVAIQQRSNPMLSRAIRTPNHNVSPVVRTPEMINRGFAGRASGLRHPAPLPSPTAQTILPGFKRIPPRPTIKINNVSNGIIVSWTVDALTPEHEKIATYQIYAYEETRALPSTENWKHVGDVKALLLPMAVTLTQFQEGQKYFFAVRAVDVHNRFGQFSIPKTWQ